MNVAHHWAEKTTHGPWTDFTQQNLGIVRCDHLLCLGNHSGGYSPTTHDWLAIVHQSGTNAKLQRNLQAVVDQGKSAAG